MIKNIYYKLGVTSLFIYGGMSRVAFAEGDSDNAENANVASSTSTNTPPEITDATTFGISNDVLLYIALGVAVVAFLLALIALIVAIRKNSALKRTIRILNNKLNSNEKYFDGAIQGLQKNVDELQKSERELKQAQQNIHTAVENENRRSTTDVATVAPKVKHEPTDEELYRDFVNAYNALRNDTAGGMAARTKRMQFLQQYHVQGIVCTNYTKRMTNPDIPPAFQAADPKSAHYWAMPLREGRLAVVPTMKDYEEQYHSTAGAKEVFKSNFQSGSCHKVIVKKPAIFMGTDTCSVPGELILQK